MRSKRSPFAQFLCLAPILIRDIQKSMPVVKAELSLNLDKIESSLTHHTYYYKKELMNYEIA